MGLLTKIEEILSVPLELFHKRAGFHPVDLNRLAVRSMEKGCRKGVRKVYAPNAFAIRLSPADYEDLRPFLEIMRSDICGELRRVVDERNYFLVGDLFLEIIRDSSIPEGAPKVDAIIKGEENRDDGLFLAEIKEGWDERDTGRSSLEPVTIIGLPGMMGSHEKAARTQEDPETIALEAGAARSFPPARPVVSKSLKGRIRTDRTAPRAVGSAGEHTNLFRSGREPGRFQQAGPDSVRRIEWIAGTGLGRKPVPHDLDGTIGRLEVKGSKILFEIRQEGVFVENRGAEPVVFVNKTPTSGAFLEDGSEVQIERMGFVYRRISNQEESPKAVEG